MLRYLTGVSNPSVRAYAVERGNVGLLNTPNTNYSLQDWPFWAADNGAFNAQTYVGDERWFHWLQGKSTHAGTCLFATAPDVVGHASATLERSLPWLPKIRAAGFPAALVAQDGLEDLEVPWNTFDVMFVGGSTDWKLGSPAASLTQEAKRRGKGVHVGRVNSFKRMAHSKLVMGADTADGTFLAFGPQKNLVRLDGWFTKLSNLDQGKTQTGEKAS